MAGLHIAEPSSEDLSKHSMSTDMKSMLDNFRKRSIIDIEDEDCEKMLKDEKNNFEVERGASLPSIADLLSG